jgi:hypothetical protein
MRTLESAGVVPTDSSFLSSAETLVKTRVHLLGPWPIAARARSSEVPTCCRSRITVAYSGRLHRIIKQGAAFCSEVADRRAQATADKNLIKFTLPATPAGIHEAKSAAGGMSAVSAHHALGSSRATPPHEILLAFLLTRADGEISPHAPSYPSSFPLATKRGIRYEPASRSQSQCLCTVEMPGC